MTKSNWEGSDAITKLVLKPGDLIFSEGEIGYHFYIVESGKVQIFKKNKDGKKVEIGVVEQGQSFGEFALLDQKPRSASAQALTLCHITKISPEGYEALLSELPTWAVSMLKSFVQRIKHTNELLQKVPQFLSRDD